VRAGHSGQVTTLGPSREAPSYSQLNIAPRLADAPQMNWIGETGTGDGAGVLVIVGCIAVITIGSLIDVLTMPADARYRSGSKAIWTVAILLTGFFGAVLYLFAGRPQVAERRHKIYLDKRLNLYWCDSCSFTAKDKKSASLHASIQVGSRPQVIHDVLVDDTEARRPLFSCEGCDFESDDLRVALAHHQGTSLTESDDDADAAPALAMAPPPTSTGFKTCPDCAEEVRFAARKCRFCGYLFSDAAASA
jgi:hypothetical protein